MVVFHGAEDVNRATACILGNERNLRKQAATIWVQSSVQYEFPRVPQSAKSGDRRR
jgi:hypothetical protein